MNIPLSTLAAAAPAGSCPTGTGSPLAMPVMLVIGFGLMYFMMIRPQKRREKERRAMIDRVKAGDRVLLTSGILGEITRVTETSLIVQIAEKTKIEIVKAAISQVLNEGDVPSEIESAK